MYSMRPSARIGCCRGCGRAAPGTRGSAGRWPATSTATATAEATATATATAKAGLLWDGGVGPVAGDAVNPQTGPAAGGCAFGRLRSSASQSKRPHPWRLGRAIHGAHAPATGPIPPSTIPRCCWWVSTLVDTVDPRHAWMLFDHFEIFDFDGDSSTHGVDLPDTGKLSKVGRCRMAGCPRHGCRGQAYKDVLAASPPSDTAPPSHGTPAVAVAVEVAGQRPALPRVPGAARPEPGTLTLPAWPLRSRRRSLHAVTAPLRDGRCRRWRRG